MKANLLSGCTLSLLALLSSCTSYDTPEELRLAYTEAAQEFLEDGDSSSLKDILDSDKEKSLISMPSEAKASLHYIQLAELNPLLQAVLMPASEARRIELIALLLKEGADINTEMDSVESIELKRADGTSYSMAIHAGRTALSLACELEGEQTALIKYLMESGADLQADAGEDSAFHLAVSSLKVEAAKLFIQAGADVKKLPQEGYESVQSLAGHGTQALPMIDLLLKNGFDINKRNSFKSTFLHYSCPNGGCECHPQTDYSDQTRMALALIKRGANKKLRDSHGETIIDSASLSLPYTKSFIEAVKAAK